MPPSITCMPTTREIDTSSAAKDARKPSKQAPPSTQRAPTSRPRRRPRRSLALRNLLKVFQGRRCNADLFHDRCSSLGGKLQRFPKVGSGGCPQGNGSHDRVAGPGRIVNLYARRRYEDRLLSGCYKPRFAKRHNYSFECMPALQVFGRLPSIAIGNSLPPPERFPCLGSIQADNRSAGILTKASRLRVHDGWD